MLRRQAAISGDHCPAILPCLVSGVAIDEDGFYGEGLVGSHQRPVPVFDGGNNWIGMKMLSHSVPNKIGTDRDFETL